MPHLDGIRAFAVVGVIIEHWAGGFPESIRKLVEHLDLGGWGVECFFVLSGFLITKLLLQAKKSDQTLSTALSHFYSRRALRIFPAYYLALLIGTLVFPPFREDIGWHVFYLGNFYPLWHDTFVPIGGHFWSLAVEEQYYLIWPLVVLLLPVSSVARTALIVCLLAPLSRLALWYQMDGSHLSIWTFPTTAMDLLGFGAFLACYKQQNRLEPSDIFLVRLRVIALVALLTYITCHTVAKDSLAFSVFGRTLAALFFGALILQASYGFKGLTSFVLGNRIVAWIGMVSYGLYIFHPFVPNIYIYIIRTAKLSLDTYGQYYVRYPLLFGLLLLTAAASFYLWEQPIRRYRRHFG